MLPRCVLCFKQAKALVAEFGRLKHSSQLQHILDIDKSLGAKGRANQVSSREAGLRFPTPVNGTAKEMQNGFYTTTLLNYM